MTLNGVKSPRVSESKQSWRDEVTGNSHLETNVAGLDTFVLLMNDCVFAQVVFVSFLIIA